MKIQHVTKNCRDKAAALNSFASSAGIDLAHICFMGDDVNDLPAMRLAGVSAAPANAAQEVLANATFLTKNAGGNGAVRELIETLFAAQGLTASEIYSRS